MLCNGIGDVPGCEAAKLRVLGYIHGYLGYITARTTLDLLFTFINKLNFNSMNELGRKLRASEN